jgi:MraZ protein
MGNGGDAMLLTGTFTRSLDEKQRTAIPKRLRDALGSHVGVLYVTPGSDGSLSIYTEEELSRLADRLAAGSPAQEEVRAFGRLFYARAERVELDSQGRIRLPPELVTAAGLGRELVLLGVQNHIEVWDKSRWETYLSARQSRFDEIAEAAFSGPPSKRS